MAQPCQSMTPAKLFRLSMPVNVLPVRCMQKMEVKSTPKDYQHDDPKGWKSNTRLSRQGRRATCAGEDIPAALCILLITTTVVDDDVSHTPHTQLVQLLQQVLERLLELQLQGMSLCTAMVCCVEVLLFLCTNSGLKWSEKVEAPYGQKAVQNSRHGASHSLTTQPLLHLHLSIEEPDHTFAFTCIL